jgi:hypothetical protein
MNVTKKDLENRIDKRIVGQTSYESNFIETEKYDIDIWELNRKEREHMLTQIAEYRRKNRVRDWIELLFVLGFICYMIYDIYKDGGF